MLQFIKFLLRQQKLNWWSPLAQGISFPSLSMNFMLIWDDVWYTSWDYQVSLVYWTGKSVSTN